MATTTVEHLKNRFIVRVFTKRGKEVGDARFHDLDGDGTYTIRMIQVNDRYQRRGIGTLIIKTAMRQERVHKIKATSNKSTLQFYLKLGFKITRDRIFSSYDLLWEKTY